MESFGKNLVKILLYIVILFSGLALALVGIGILLLSPTPISFPLAGQENLWETFVALLKVEKVRGGAFFLLGGLLVFVSVYVRRWFF